jgi:hypothetical protein
MKIDYKKLIAGVEHRKKTVFPFSSQEIYLRVLSEYDLQQASRFADQEYKERNVGLANVDERNEYKTMYEVYCAVVDEDGVRVFPTFEDFCKACTPEIARRLIEEQSHFQAETSPDITNLSESELDEVVDELKKNSEIVQTISDSRILKKLILYLVSQLSKQQTDRSSQ